MKTTYRTTHSYKPHSRAERALVLAVLTVLLAGGGMTPAMAKDVTIEKGETVILKNYWKNEVSLMYDAKEKETDADKTSSPSCNHITIYGNVTLDDPPWATYTVSTVFTMEGATALSDNHLLIDGGNLTTAAKCLYGAFGAVDSTGLVTNNEVIIKGDSNTANCLVYGGYSRYGGANENKVSITDGSVTAIWGGMGWASSANGNHVTVDHANVTGDNGDAIYGGDAGNSADNNQVLVKGGTISRGIYGGHTRNQHANGNHVETSSIS